jgi:hypothetical protein
MVIFLLIVLSIIVFAAVAYVILVARTLRASARRDQEVASLLDPVMAQVASSEAVPAAAIDELARNPLTRNRLYDALQKLGRGDLFPAAFYTTEAFAESDLSYWLAHGHELGQAPDEIELIERFIRDDSSGEKRTYCVFKYRVHPPHWAASNGWLVGIAGPYSDDENPTTMASQTFSAFEPLDTRTPSEHLDRCLQARSSPAVR